METKINCRVCAAEIPAENINLNHLLAKCSYCNSIFSIEGELGLKARGDKAKASGQPDDADFAADSLLNLVHDAMSNTVSVDDQKRRGPVPQPKSIHMDYDQDTLIFRRHWFTPDVLPMLFFAVFWDGFMLFWYIAAFTQNQIEMAIFGLLHLSVGVGITYYVLMGLFNHTWIRANSEALTVTHGPIPWFNRRVASPDVEQLYIRTTSYSVNNRYHYQLTALQTDGTMQGLLDSPNPRELVFVEQQLEQHLGIHDRKVHDEARIAL
jgi:hypothetical protein